jgi:Icc-related predicted phosphoesterase
LQARSPIIKTNMQLHILSDLHLEFAPFTPPIVDSNVVILAGDIQPGNKGVLWAKANFPHSEVIYIPGNHEYYGQSLPDHTKKLKVINQESNVHVLENDVFILGEVVFLGCTLWTDFELFGNPRVAGYYATQNLTDYRRIKVSPSYRRLRSIDTAGIHHGSCQWLESQFKQYTGKKLIVVTHHAPSARSLPSECEEDILSAAYATRMDDFVANSNISLWVHGHIHQNRDYSIGNTRIICNPRGYFHEQNPDFEADMLIGI